MPAYSIEALAQKLKGEARSSQPLSIEGVASLSMASNKQIACLTHSHQLSSLASSQAAAILTNQKLASQINDRAVIVVSSATDALYQLVDLFSSLSTLAAFEIKIIIA